MVEVGYFSRIAKLSINDTLLALKDAGVDSLPGGGAEIFNPRVRHIICDHKVSGQQWLNIARTAHQIGLRSNATMLYGHIETDEDRVDHLLALRALQDETHGFVRPSSRWPFIRTIRACRICPSPPASTI